MLTKNRILCNAIGYKKAPIFKGFKVQNQQSDGFIFIPLKMSFYCVTKKKNNAYGKRGFKTAFCLKSP